MYIPVGRLELPAQSLRGMQTELPVLLHQTHQGVTFHEIDLARSGRLRGKFKRFAGNHGAQSEYLASLGDFQDQHLAVARGGGELRLSRTQNEGPTRYLTFYKENRIPRICAQMADCTEQFQNLG